MVGALINDHLREFCESPGVDRVSPGRRSQKSSPRLCSAIVDRLNFNGAIIETGTGSYRLASTRARAEEPAKAG